MLREARTSDRAELERLRADPEIDRYMGVDTAPAGSVLKRVFVGSASGALADFVLQGPAGRIMGLLSFWERAVPHHAAELSIWLARDYRGHGYGTDAVLLGVRHIFKRFRLHKIYLRVLWYNTRLFAATNAAVFAKRVGCARRCASRACGTISSTWAYCAPSSTCLHPTGQRASDGRSVLDLSPSPFPGREGESLRRSARGRARERAK